MEEYKGSTGELPGGRYSTRQLSVQAIYDSMNFGRNYFGTYKLRNASYFKYT